MVRLFTTLLVVLGISLSGCSRKQPPEVRAFDRQNMSMIVLRGEHTKLTEFYNADFVIVGGGIGGVAAAIAACSSGRSTILIDPSDQIAACFSSPDTLILEGGRLADTAGSSSQLQEFRRLIREWYAENPARSQPVISEGNISTEFDSDQFCLESDAAVSVIYDMISEQLARERLTVLNRHVVASGVVYNNRIASLQVVDLDAYEVNQVTGWIYLDATDTGDLVAMLGAGFALDPEAKHSTNEPHAPYIPDAYGLRTWEFYEVPGDDAGEVSIVPVTEMPSVDAVAIDSLYIPVVPRRVNAFTTILEQDIAAATNPGPRARFYSDSVGIGHSPLTIEDANGELQQLDTRPFQIPFSALIPRDLINCVIAGPCLGSSFIANTAFATPAVEWAIGEGAGELAGFCAGNTITPHEAINSDIDLNSLREILVQQRGIPIYWYNDISPGDPDFVKAQLAPFKSESFREEATTLSYY